MKKTSPAQRLKQVQEAKRRLEKKFPAAVIEKPQFKALVSEQINVLQALAKAIGNFDGTEESAKAIETAASLYVASFETVRRVGEEIFRELTQPDGNPPIH